MLNWVWEADTDTQLLMSVVATFRAAHPTRGPLTDQPLQSLPQPSSHSSEGVQTPTQPMYEGGQPIRAVVRKTHLPRLLQHVVAVHCFLGRCAL